MKRVVVMAPYDDVTVHRLENAVPGEYEIIVDEKPKEEILKETEIIVGYPPIDIIEQMPKLRWIQCDYAGVDRYTKGEFPKDRVLLTNTSGAFGQSIGEYLLTMLLSLYKKLNLYRDQQNKKIWKDLGKEETLVGKTVLIVGAGNIGQHFAKLISVFDTYTIGIRKNPGEIPPCFATMHGSDQLEELLPQADVVVLTLPSTKDTYHLFDESKLRLMKQGSVILNVGRGDVLVTKDLVQVLEEGDLKGAALDVVEEEPLPVESPLWDMEQVILTPHISGGSWGHLEESYDRMMGIIEENLRRYHYKVRLKNIIDFDLGY